MREGEKNVSLGRAKAKRGQKNGAPSGTSSEVAQDLTAAKPKKKAASSSKEELTGTSSDPAALALAVEGDEADGSLSLALINRSAIKKSLKRAYPELRISPEFFLTFSKTEQKRLKAAAESALAAGRKTLSSQDVDYRE
jgi:histone H3/H4